jgi:hypothetical protein
VDIFLGMEGDGGQSSYSSQPGKKSFQERMLSYMSIQHRTFLQQHRDVPCQLRTVAKNIAKEKGEFPLVEVRESVEGV